MSRIIFITGASSGIGASLARHYAGLGETVVLFARRIERLRQVQSEIERNGGKAVIFGCDICERESVQTAVAAAISELGCPDLVILNAGIARPVSLTPLNIDDIRAVMDTNYWGAMYMMEAVLPDMLSRKKGQIAAISSLAALITGPGSGAYSASKSALLMMMDSLRQQLKPSGIGLSVICPGFIKSAMTAQNEFPMPMLMERDRAIQKITRAIERHQAIDGFPFLLWWLIRLKWVLPGWIGDLFTSGRTYQKDSIVVRDWD